MRLLIDSHVALWWLEGNPSLGAESSHLLLAADEVFFSAVTPWELGIKRALGKVSFPDGLSSSLVEGGFTPLPIAITHAELAAELPAHHRDPFDRMLVAQAQLESLALMSADRAFGTYTVELIDATA
jgi:PIN domain nuclease of toxin-antitoxin system